MLRCIFVQQSNLLEECDLFGMIRYIEILCGQYAKKCQTVKNLWQPTPWRLIYIYPIPLLIQRKNQIFKCLVSSPYSFIATSKISSQLILA